MANTSYLVIWVPVDSFKHARETVASIRPSAYKGHWFVREALDSLQKFCGVHSVYEESVSPAYAMLTWGTQLHGSVSEEDILVLLPLLYHTLVTHEAMHEYEYVRAVVSTENDMEDGYERPEGEVYTYGEDNSEYPPKGFVLKRCTTRSRTVTRLTPQSKEK